MAGIGLAVLAMFVPGSMIYDDEESLGLWFVFQVVNGLGALGGDEAGGIAYSAHIGGFVAGLLLVKFFVRKPITEVIPRRETF